MEHIPSWESNRISASQEFLAFYGIRRFITAFKSAHYLAISWATSIQSIHPQPTSWSSILKLSYYLLLGLPSHYFPLGFPTKILLAPFLSPVGATCSAHLILLALINRKIFGEEYRKLSSSLCACLHSPVSSSVLDPNILLSTIFSSTLSLRYYLTVSDQVSHPYTTTGIRLGLILWYVQPK